MTKQADLLNRLPELPLEAFELSSKLDYAEHAPVITNRFEAIRLAAPVIPTPHAPDRSSHELKTYFAWVIYPHVMCVPMPELEVMARVNLEPAKASPPRHGLDLEAIAEQRLFFKLSRLRDFDLGTPWGCEVRYGPWFGVITYTQSCSDSLPDRWALSSSVLDMKIEWEGGPGDMPSVPNLTVWWDPAQPASVEVQCCPGHYPCNGGCLPDDIDCPGHLTPA